MSINRNLDSREDTGKELSEFSAEDLAKLFHYPSIGQLFSSSNSSEIEAFRSRLISTQDHLEKVVRYGSREDADRANIVIKSIGVTLDFLSSLQEMRLTQV